MHCLLNVSYMAEIAKDRRNSIKQEMRMVELSCTK